MYIPCKSRVCRRSPRQKAPRNTLYAWCLPPADIRHLSSTSSSYNRDLSEPEFPPWERFRETEPGHREMAELLALSIKCGSFCTSLPRRQLYLSLFSLSTGNNSAYPSGAAPQDIALARSCARARLNGCPAKKCSGRIKRDGRRRGP